MSEVNESFPAASTEKSHRSLHVNVGPLQRAGSVLMGGALMMGGLTHRSAAGYFAAGLGGALLARGTTGHCPVIERVGTGPAAADVDTGAESAHREQ